MVAKAKRLLSLWGLSARMDLQWFTQDTFICIMCIVSDIVANIASISGIFLLSVRFQGVGGLSADEVLFMLGFYTMADGLTYMFGSFNISHISRRIGRGQLDHMLIQPLPLWMQLVTGGFVPISGHSTFVCGAVLTAVAAIRLRLAVTPVWFVLLLVYLLARTAIVIGANYLVGSAAFYKPVACEEISSLTNDLFTSLGRFPLSGMPQWLVGILVTVLPVGLTAWLPSLVLLGQLNAPLAMLLPLLIGVMLMSLATFAFQKGMKHYVTYGSNRYRDMGHRG